MLRPEIIMLIKINSSLIHRLGGKLYGVMNTDQQVYADPMMSVGQNPSVQRPTRTLRTSDAKFGYA